MNQFCMRSDDRTPTIARGTAQGWARRLAAVLMGLAAQESARTGQAIDLTQGAYALAQI